MSLGKSDLQEFDAAIASAGFSNNQFSATIERNDIPRSDGLYYISGVITIVRAGNSASKTYKYGHGACWSDEFLASLRAGEFGAK